MAEEQMLETKTFAEINADYAAGDDFGLPPDEGNKGTPPPPPAGEPPQGEPPAGEPVNWETKYKEVETQFTQKEQDYLAKLKDHETKIAEFEKKPPPITHKNSQYSKLEILNETAPEKVPLFQKLLWGNPDAKELWKMDFLEKNPDFKEDPEMVETMLQAEFKDYLGEESDPESKEYKVAEARLRIAGNQIRNGKLKEFDSIIVPDSQEALKVREQQKTELAKSWEIPFSDMTKQSLKVSQKIALDDKSEVEVDFGIQPEDNKKYNELMGLYILHNELKPTAENAEKARNYAIGEILREKFPEILKATFQKEFDKRYAAWQKTRNNNTPLTPTNISADGKKSIDQQINEMIETGEPHVPSR